MSRADESLAPAGPYGGVVRLKPTEPVSLLIKFPAVSPDRGWPVPP